MSEDNWLRTGIGRSTPDSITLRGRDLAGELMGKVSFTELAFLLVADRMPSAGETRLFDASLVALADHGLTPSVLAARLTWTGATESLQGSVAAGLLGAGNVFLGVVEDTARFLAAIIAEAGADVSETAAAERAVAAEIAAGRRIPGLGHPVHKVEDPRTPRLYA
ncbi:MAG TPA: citryl-CoA lyase, partial [Acidimicrobiia bacterium]|nr:citryl-CoA lyase [Acidimicrobiia bacterium]